MLNLICGFLVIQESETTVRFKFKFFERLLEILKVVSEKLDLPVRHQLNSKMLVLFNQFSKFHEHKLMLEFQLRSSILLIDLGVANLDCLFLLEQIVKKKYQRDSLQLAIKIMRSPFSPEIQTQLAMNLKFYSTLLGIISKETGTRPKSPSKVTTRPPKDRNGNHAGESPARVPPTKSCPLGPVGGEFAGLGRARTT